MEFEARHIAEMPDLRRRLTHTSINWQCSNGAFLSAVSGPKSRVQTLSIRFSDSDINGLSVLCSKLVATPFGSIGDE
jgi:hypothetical protein